MMSSCIAKPHSSPQCFLLCFRSMGGGARPRFPKNHKRSFRNDFDSGEGEHGEVALLKDNRLFRRRQGQDIGQRQQYQGDPKMSRKSSGFAIDKYNDNNSASSAKASKDDTSFQSIEKSHRRKHLQHSSRTRRKDVADDGYGPSDGVSSGAWRKARKKPSPGRNLKKNLQLPLNSLPKKIQSMLPEIKNYIIRHWLKMYPRGGQLRKLQRDIAYRMDNSPGKLEHEHLLPIVTVLVEEGKIELDEIRDSNATITIRRPRR